MISSPKKVVSDIIFCIAGLLKYSRMKRDTDNRSQIAKQTRSNKKLIRVEGFGLIWLQVEIVLAVF